MLLTAAYLKGTIVPVMCAIVIAGLGFRLHDKLFKLQQSEDLSVSKILQVGKKYILLMIIATVVGAGSIIQTIDSYFK